MLRSYAVVKELGYVRKCNVLLKYIALIKKMGKEAVDTYLQLLEVSKQAMARHSKIWRCLNIGNVLFSLELYDGALAIFKEWLALFSRVAVPINAKTTVDGANAISIIVT